MLTINLRDAKAGFSSLVDEAVKGEIVTITRHGKPVAALIDARLFERIRRMQERFDALCDRLELTYTGVPEAQALAEIERATARARTETADAWRVAGRLPALPARRTRGMAKSAMPATKAAPAKRRKAAAKTKTAR